jgi:hypothetical protein
MSISRRLLVVGLLIASVTMSFRPSTVTAQEDIVDFDLLNIITCSDFDPIDDAENFAICAFFQEFLLNDMLESEAFVDQVFAGFRQDMPRFLRFQLPDKIFILIALAEIDDVGGTLARAAPLAFADFIPNPFIRRGRFVRAWSLPIAGFMEIDIDDLPFLILSDTMVDVAVHESFHALGHPSAFDRSFLTGPVSIFGQINFIGVNDGGFGLEQFRVESGNPFAQFVPLSQFDDHAHLSMFEPAFNRPAEGLQEVFLAFAGAQGFMSRSLRGMFADLGYRIRTVNLPGVIDIDGDGTNDDPLIVNPNPPTLPNGFGSDP